MSGVIKGKGDGKWGRITINRDGSLLLENVTLSDIKITNCDLHAGSGEYPIPFADRMNILEDFASGDVYPEMTFGGRTDEQYRKGRGRRLRALPAGAGCHPHERTIQWLTANKK